MTSPKPLPSGLRRAIRFTRSRTWLAVRSARFAAAELSLGRGIYLERGRDHKVMVTTLRVKGEGMAAAQFEALEVSEVDVVRRWRFDELLRAGYDDEDAMELAFHLDVDLHLATNLVRRGCPSSTAVRIAL